MIAQNVFVTPFFIYENTLKFNYWFIFATVDAAGAILDDVEQYSKFSIKGVIIILVSRSGGTGRRAVLRGQCP